MNSGVYAIVNNVTGKAYCGSAVNLSRRWRKHRTQLRAGIHHSQPLQRAWFKYGEGAFNFQKIIICSPDNLILYEQSVINAFMPAYNVCKIAGSCLGLKRSQETRKLMSVYQNNRSPEHTAKLCNARYGRKLSPESILKMRNSNKGKNYRVGYKHSFETKLKISKAKLGKTTRFGYSHTQETRNKISAARKARRHVSNTQMALL